MAKEHPKHIIKDSVFKSLFGDKKYLLLLYKTLHPEDEDVTESDIEDVTINPVFMGSEYNDLGFSVGDKLISLVESQSTWSVNIIFRAFLYLADTYQKYFTRTKQNLYSTKKVLVPEPELYVIYTGNKKNIPEYITLEKEFFDGNRCALNARIKVLSDANDKTIIGEYIMFCKVYDGQRELYGRTEEAIKQAIKICKDKNVLKGYLTERENEVISIMMTLFNEEQLAIAYDADITKQAVEKAERETAQRVERETAQKMIKSGGFTNEQISAFSGLSVEEVKELVNTDEL